MSERLARRTVLRLTGGLGVAGLVGLAGIQPASAVDDPYKARLLAMRIQAMQIMATNLHLSNVGYDQDLDDRWSFLDQKKRAIVPNKECDCSSSCAGIAWLAGFPVSVGKAAGINSASIANDFAKHGFKKITFVTSGKDKTDVFTDVHTGDFLVGPGHVIFCMEKGKQWWSAEHGETTKTLTSGGKAGDQTGDECIIRKPYVRDKGWAHILRPQ